MGNVVIKGNKTMIKNEIILLSDVIKELNRVFNKKGGKIIPSNNSVPMGAATFHPEGTFFASLSQNKDTFIHFHQICTRPADSCKKYRIEDPIRSDVFCQYQVLMSCAPKKFALNKAKNTIKEVIGVLCKESGYENYSIEVFEDNWQSPSLGAFGLGWELRVNGIEAVQITYIQKMGGVDLEVPCIELAFGVDRIAWIANALKNSKCGSLYLIPNIEILVEKESDLNLKNEYDYARREFIESYNEFSESDLIDKVHAHIDCAKKTKDPKDSLKYLSLASHTFNILDSNFEVETSFREKSIDEMKEVSNFAAKEFIKSIDSSKIFRSPASIVKKETINTRESSFNSDIVLSICHENIPMHLLEFTVRDIYSEIVNNLSSSKVDVDFIAKANNKTVCIYLSFDKNNIVQKGDFFVIKKTKGPFVEYHKSSIKFIEKFFNVDAENIIRKIRDDKEKFVICDCNSEAYIENGRVVVSLRESLIDVIYKSVKKYLEGGLRYSKTMKWSPVNIEFYRPILSVSISSDSKTINLIDNSNIFYINETDLKNNEEFLLEMNSKEREFVFKPIYLKSIPSFNCNDLPLKIYQNNSSEPRIINYNYDLYDCDLLNVEFNSYRNLIQECLIEEFPSILLFSENNKKENSKFYWFIDSCNDLGEQILLNSMKIKEKKILKMLKRDLDNVFLGIENSESSQNKFKGVIKKIEPNNRKLFSYLESNEDLIDEIQCLFVELSLLYISKQCSVSNEYGSFKVSKKLQDVMVSCLNFSRKTTIKLYAEFIYLIEDIFRNNANKSQFYFSKLKELVDVYVKLNKEKDACFRSHANIISLIFGIAENVFAKDKKIAIKVIADFVNRLIVIFNKKMIKEGDTYSAHESIVRTIIMNAIKDDFCELNLYEEIEYFSSKEFLCSAIEIDKVTKKTLRLHNNENFTDALNSCNILLSPKFKKYHILRADSVKKSWPDIKRLYSKL